MRMNVQHDTSMVVRNPSRDTSTTRPCNASGGANAIECTRKSSLPHFLAISLEYGFHLAVLSDVQWHEDRRFQGVGQRLNEPFCLVGAICDGDLGSERAERLGAPPADRSIIGDADDEPPLALEELCFGGRDLDVTCRLDSLLLQILLGAVRELAEGLTSVFGIVDPRYFLAIDLQLAFAPRSDLDLELVVPNGRKEFLLGRALANGQGLI